MVESYDDLVFLIENNRIKFANPSGSEQLGYSLSKIYSFNTIDIVSNAYKNIFIENIKKCLAGEELPKFEIALIKNTEEQILLDAKILLSEHEEKPAALLFARDITEIKKESTEVMRLSAAVKSLHSAVTITDIDRNIIYITPAHTSIFGYRLDELIGKNSSMLYPFDDPAGVSEKIYEAILMVGWEGERLSIKKNGEVFPVYEKTSVVKDKNGSQIAIVSVVEDITLRKNLLNSLEESEEKYRNLVETANRAIIAFDDRCKITLFNPAAEGMFKYKQDE
ncbi:MAG: PAS domain S-box protein [Candidatus Dadabacteria bacterium]|nr:PAS domain S-box protein [Candidatus Dadabacteria bacterium]NIS08038.1 PAS domain S-box protein [Candidatus Dadabacteria bacterium]NIV40861.1 PAS domain S-box protein [Candidatus Dadabacteria bacterium]NIY21616.1 PAS domain S-box protein [Candidatus Dadabacteria bacterium]